MKKSAHRSGLSFAARHPASFITIKDLKKIRKSNFVILGILLIVYFGNTMFTTLNVPPVTTVIQNKDENKFAGSAVCAICHKDIYGSHIKTAHYLDSRRGLKNLLKEVFLPAKIICL